MTKGLREPLADRFWRFVEKSGGCWLWLGSRIPAGYGHIKVSGRTVMAHRVAFELTHGPIEDGLWVLHRCDNPSCVNPAHLYTGDRAQNMKDAHERGRIDLSKVASAPRPGARKASHY